VVALILAGKALALRLIYLLQIGNAVSASTQADKELFAQPATPLLLGNCQQQRLELIRIQPILILLILSSHISFQPVHLSQD